MIIIMPVEISNGGYSRLDAGQEEYRYSNVPDHAR